MSELWIERFCDYRQVTDIQINSVGIVDASFPYSKEIQISSLFHKKIGLLIKPEMGDYQSEFEKWKSKQQQQQQQQQSHS